METTPLREEAELGFADAEVIKNLNLLYELHRTQPNTIMQPTICSRPRMLATR
ncbi:hypothetical protein WMF28_30345 [Sorangium sp. So ce590]|uniref:hypothetical protein n=1 Tax=Sorangium sp. So ce590 TaxID=3133317 RepID=UPI003F61C8FD